MLSPKLLKFLLVSGLIVGLVFGLRKKSKFGPLGIVYVLLSPYRRLLRYIIAQAKVESADFTSNVYMTDNNMFGMKVNSRPLETPGLQSPEGNRYAHYERDFDSIRDFVAWLSQTSFPTQVSGVEQYSIEMKQRGFYGPSAVVYTALLNSRL